MWDEYYEPKDNILIISLGEYKSLNRFAEYLKYMPKINLNGKKAIIFSVTDDKSLAFAIAKRISQAGAKIAIGYQLRNEVKINDIKEKIDNTIFLPFDVTDENLIEGFFRQVSEKFGKIDFIVHSMAFTKRETLKGMLVETSKENYQLAHDVSVFSLTQIIQKFLPILNEYGSIIALTFIERVVPTYNVMGVCKTALNSSIRYLANDLGEKQIRVNGISAGPVETSAASAIEAFPKMLEAFKTKSALRRNITSEEVANTALFLLSDMSKGITGQIVNVDAGYNIMGV